MIKRPFIFFIFLLIISLLLTACGAPPTANSPAAAIATSQPAPPEKTPTFAPAPKPTIAPTPEDIGVSPEDISLDGQGLVDDWQAVLVPATPFDNMHAPGPSGLPTHIQVLFNGVSNPGDREPGAPVIYIIPIDAYRQLWEQNDTRIVSDQIRQITEFISQPPDPAPVRGLPVLPVEEAIGVNDFATQLRPAPGNDAASPNGFRFVGRFAMDANPLTNEGLRYIYQGITTDGRYLVAIFFPVRTDKLPDDIGGVSEKDAAAFQADGLGYLADKSVTLDALPADAWQPDLAKLDALAASLKINR